MRCQLALLVAAGLLAMSSFASAEVAIRTFDAHWNEGAPDCAAHPQPPLEVHEYDKHTFVLRESLCATFEAPFLYLLIGADRAMLIDTGDVADPKLMPLAVTVMQLLPEAAGVKLPLLVVHTHRHLDHRAGDGQFAHLPGVEVVGYDLDSVKRFYRFTHWPNGVAQIDLGHRVIDVMPTPGHNETHVSFYDRNTALFFSGDFLMPGRLLIDDAAVDLASAQRVAAFVRDRPVSHVLGGHIEFDSAGATLPWESQYHPNEHALPLSRNDLLALPAAIAGFNGFYGESGGFVLIDSMHMLIALAVCVVLALLAVVAAVVWFVRRRRRNKLAR